MQKSATAALAMVMASCGPNPDRPPEIALSGAWARPTVGPQSSAAVYLQLRNSGGSDRLVAAASAVASGATLHETRNEGGIARMRALPDGLQIVSGGTLLLEPGGPHIMLTGLAKPLRGGESFPLTLRFERSGALSTTVAVSDDAAEPGPAGNHEH